MIALVIDENLRLVLQAAESSGMNDPIPVPLKGRAGLTFWLPMETPATVLRMGGIGGKICD